METHSVGQIIFLTSLGVTLFIFTLVNIIAFWRIFEKAGKPGWKSIIPVYNLITLFEILNKPWYWILFLMIPGLHIFIPFWMIVLLGERFGMDDLFIMGLFLFGFIFIPILGFGDAKYLKPAEAVTNSLV